MGVAIIRWENKPGTTGEKSTATAEHTVLDPSLDSSSLNPIEKNQRKFKKGAKRFFPRLDV